MHDGDAHLAMRAIDSLVGQDLDHGLFEVMIAFDGGLDVKPEVEAHLQEACANRDFLIGMGGSGEKTGYYTVPRNYALPVGADGRHATAPYIVNMDADNEFESHHLRALLNAIRTPHPERGLPHFAYTRRLYVLDPGASDKMPSGPSPLIPWTRETSARLMVAPDQNFVDTGDFIAPRALYYEVGERTGYPWNPDCRRFGDWDLMVRFAKCGFFGVAIDQASHIYHWTGKNLQTTRWTEDVVALPIEIYEELRKRGAIINTPAKEGPDESAGE
jgi:hypothetical protein